MRRDIIHKHTQLFFKIKTRFLLHKHIWIILRLIRLNSFAFLNIHSVGNYCCFLSPILSSMPRLYYIFVSSFISIQSTRYKHVSVKTNLKRNSQKTWKSWTDSLLFGMYNDVNFKSVFENVSPHVAMQGCLNGTIIGEFLKIKWSMLVLKRTIMLIDKRWKRGPSVKCAENIKDRTWLTRVRVADITQQFIQDHEAVSTSRKNKQG